MSKRGSLAAFTTTKSGASESNRSPTASSPEKHTEKEKRRGQTLRLSQTAWRQLKFMAVEQERPAHDLLIEAVNDLFEKYGKLSLS
ncbi:hypothetical protein MYX84_08685 [Acidobacteria bacterium AH-259-O06]|nr:hypothetical protein [Acidobacteria bacterium AH-259-O06]